MDHVGHGRVDHNALRTNQAVIITILLAAYLTDLPVLAALCGIIMLAGSLFNRPGFLPLYRTLRALNIIQPDLKPDHPEPHRFAQFVGAGVLLAASIAFLINAPLLGWLLTGIVIALAALNLFLGFCLGCAMYFWFARLRIPGFDKLPLSDGD